MCVCVCVCRSSYSSGSSRSCESARSVNSNTSSPGVAVEPEIVLEEAKDVRDYETIDHKLLKQWKGNKGHLPEGRHFGNTLTSL